MVLVTEGMLFNCEPKAISAKRGVLITAITSLKMSTLPDNFLNVSVEGEHDLLVVCAQKIELVNVLKARYEALVRLPTDR